jgi:hypothetical protein
LPVVSAAVTGHEAWGVRLIVGPDDVATYRAWCECGWLGAAHRPHRSGKVRWTVADCDRAAAVEAFTHATGHNPFDR